MEAGERVNALGTKKLFPLIVSMSIPAICGNITTALYNVVDRLFVGQFVGRNALGAIGLMFPLNNSDYLQKARKYGHFTGYKN